MAIAIADNKGCNVGRVRHFQARVHWAQEVVTNLTVGSCKVPTADMPTDVLTRALLYLSNARRSKALGYSTPQMLFDNLQFSLSKDITKNI